MQKRWSGLPLPQKTVHTLSVLPTSIKVTTLTHMTSQQKCAMCSFLNQRVGGTQNFLNYPLPPYQLGMSEWPPNSEIAKVVGEGREGELREVPVRHPVTYKSETISAQAADNHETMMLAQSTLLTVDSNVNHGQLTMHRAFLAKNSAYHGQLCWQWMVLASRTTFSPYHGQSTKYFFFRLFFHFIFHLILQKLLK